MANFRNLELKILSGLRDTRFRQRLANKARDVIYRRTKQGFGITGTGNPKKVRLKKLTTKYVEQRRSRTRLGEFGRPGKSNLTLSGQLLNSMVGKATNFGFRVEIPNTQRRAFTFNGRVVKQDITNRELAKHVQVSRRFFGLTNDEKQILVRQIDTFIQRLINSL